MNSSSPLKDKIIGIHKTFLDLTSKKDALEEDLKKAKEELKFFTESEVPEALGVEDALKVESQGISISVKSVTEASIKNRQKALDFFESRGDGVLMVPVITLTGEGTDALLKVQDFCQKEGISFLVDRKVHPQTLKAYINQVLENEGRTEELKEAFNLYTHFVTKIK